MMPAREDADYITIADIEVEAVRPERAGFTLDGHGTDMTEYRLELHLDLPVDQRTRAVLGELLSQSEWRVRRRVRTPLRRGVRAALPEPKSR